MSIKKVSLYRRLYEQLRKMIEDGIYKSGDLLPSENELCAAHHLTRSTVRNALELLVQDGFIIRQHGKGSIVQNKPTGIGILSYLGTTSAVGKDYLTTQIIVKPEIRAWEKVFSFELTDHEKSVGCIYMERLRFIKNVPFLYEITMIPNVNIPRFTSRSFENKSLFEILRKHYQIHVKGGEQRILSDKAPFMIQEHLNVNKDHPILQLERKLETNRIGLHFYSQIFCNTKEHALIGRF